MLSDSCLTCKHVLRVSDENKNVKNIYDRGRCINLFREKEYIYADGNKICDLWEPDPNYLYPISGDFKTLIMPMKITGRPKTKKC